MNKCYILVLSMLAAIVLNTAISSSLARCRPNRRFMWSRRST